MTWLNMAVSCLAPGARALSAVEQMGERAEYQPLPKQGRSGDIALSPPFCLMQVI